MAALRSNSSRSRRLQGCDILASKRERIGARHITGSVLWAIGWGINLHSDHILRNLRKPGKSGRLEHCIHQSSCMSMFGTEAYPLCLKHLWGGYAALESGKRQLCSDPNSACTGYKIPRGGCFEYVSGANYLGEMLEWCGYAVAAGSLPAAAFACFTVCNIGPRGWQHHQWYKEHFPRYPRHRKAVLPFLL